MKVPPRLERLLADLLSYGSWLASSAIGLGFSLAWIDSRVGTHNLAILPNMLIAKVGIALFILLPTLRVLLMLLFFFRERDYRLAIIAALVLTIILLGFILGIRTMSAIAGLPLSEPEIPVAFHWKATSCNQSGADGIAPSPC
jgi:uncharacterized membrane protein